MPLFIVASYDFIKSPTDDGIIITDGTNTGEAYLVPMDRENMQQFIDTLINGPARYTQEHHFSSGWALVFVLAMLAIQCGAVYFIFLLTVKFFQYTRTFFSAFLRRIGIGKHEIEYAFLQLIFPADTTKSAYATEQLHILMRSMVKYRGFWDRLAARKQPYSLELVATRDDGIRYIICIPKRETETVKRTLLSFLPGLKVTEVEDYFTRHRRTKLEYR
jgi:hypothetical protein